MQPTTRSVAAMMSGGRRYRDKVLSYSPIAYWPLWEQSGTTAKCLVNPAQNGVYSGATPGNTVIDSVGRSFVCASFDGTSDYVNIYTTTLRDAFNPSEGTVIIWVKVNGVGVWTDGSERRVITLRADASNRVLGGTSGANNTLRWAYQAGGTLELRDQSGYSTTDWFHYAITWSKTADAVQPYYNGSVVGAAMTTLGVWAGNLANTTTLIGATAVATPTCWYGYLAHSAIYDTALSATQISDLASV